MIEYFFIPLYNGIFQAKIAENHIMIQKPRREGYLTPAAEIQVT
jgi:hypothetical protein